MPTASFSHEATTSAPPDLVWSLLQATSTWSEIGPVDEVWDARHDADGRLLEYRWSTAVGPTSYEGSAEVFESVDGSLMSLRLESTEVTGVLVARLAPTADGTLIAVSVEIAARGPLSGLFFPLVADAVRRGLTEQVERFAASLDGA